MKYSSQFHKTSPDEFTRRMIYKQESRNKLFAQRLINIEKKTDYNALIIESNNQKANKLLTLVVFLQCIQLVQNNSLCISNYTNEYVYLISGLSKTVLNTVYNVLEYGYEKYAAAGNYLVKFT